MTKTKEERIEWQLNHKPKYDNYTNAQNEINQQAYSKACRDWEEKLKAIKKEEVLLDINQEGSK